MKDDTAQPFAVEESIEEEGPRAPAFSDEDLALRFAARHKDDLRYVAVWNKWLRWDGQKWSFDKTYAAYGAANECDAREAGRCSASHRS
jgi:putative DNA primase/helicase